MKKEEQAYRHLSKYELLQMLVKSRQENEALQKENEALKKQLADRTITIEKAGSIARAALALNGVFAAAQRAADDYVESIKAQQQELIEKAVQEKLNRHEED